MRLRVSIFDILFLRKKMNLLTELMRSLYCIVCIFYSFAEPGRFKLKPEMSQTTFSNLRAWLKENLLLVITFSGVFLGVIIGVLLKPLELEPLTVAYLAYPGELFMRLLKLMILPLIIASLITGKSLHVTWFSYSFWSNFAKTRKNIQSLQNRYFWRENSNIFFR